MWIDILKAHFFHPVDDSLAEKARAYSSVYREWKNIEASIEYFDKQGWEETLGSEQELHEAQKLIQDTLNVAIASFSPEEKAELLQYSFLTEAEKEHLESSSDDKASIIQSRKDEANKVREAVISERDIYKGK